jgi:hypothetical protein
MNNQTQKFNSSRLFLILATFMFSLLIAGNVSAANRNPVGDFDGDGKTDVSVYRPSDAIGISRKVQVDIHFSNGG